jgi:hypothetical protein
LNDSLRADFRKEKREPRIDFESSRFVDETIEISNFLADLQEIEMFIKRFNGNMKDDNTLI